MVVSVNGVVAPLAVTEFMVFATGMRAPTAQLIHRSETPACRRRARAWQLLLHGALEKRRSVKRARASIASDRRSASR